MELNDDSMAVIDADIELECDLLKIDESIGIG